MKTLMLIFIMILGNSSFAFNIQNCDAEETQIISENLEAAKILFEESNLYYENMNAYIDETLFVCHPLKEGMGMMALSNPSEIRIPPSILSFIKLFKNNQSFRSHYRENRFKLTGTFVHELVHIQSFAQNAFWARGGGRDMECTTEKETLFVLLNSFNSENFKKFRSKNGIQRASDLMIRSDYQEESYCSGISFWVNKVYQM